MQVDPRKVNLAEADIEQYLFENPEYVHFDETYVDRWLKRQYHVPSGVIDLLGVTADGHLVVVEIKNLELRPDAIAQVRRYAFDIDHIILEMNGRNARQCYAVLVGPSVDTHTFRECEACHVHVCCFSVSFSLSVQNLIWLPETIAARRAQYEDLAQDSVLRIAAGVSESIPETPLGVLIESMLDENGELPGFLSRVNGDTA